MRSLLLALFWVGATVSAQENWPQFRGADSRGVATSGKYPTHWSPTENIKWLSEVPGSGWSSPIVWGDLVIVTSVTRQGKGEEPKKGLYFGGERPTPPNDMHQWKVFAYHFKTGKLEWERQVHEGKPPTGIHIKNTFASETPVTDGKHIFVYFGNTGLFCLDFKGRVVWSKQFPVVKTRYAWGTAASPVLHQDRIYIINDNEDESYLLALNKSNGQEVFKVIRPEKSNWATPFIWQNSLRTEIITPGTQKVRSYDLNGKLLWEFSGMSTITIMTPFTSHGLLFVSSGYVGDKHRPVYAIKPGASGDISLKPDQTQNEHIAWYQKLAAPYNPSPLVYDDHFYVLYDFGFFGCFDARTGEMRYEKERLNPGGTASFTASPWAYDGKIFCLSEEGDTYVVQAGPQFKLLGKNSLSEMCMATPALARGCLIIRTASKLYCIEQKP